MSRSNLNSSLLTGKGAAPRFSVFLIPLLLCLAAAAQADELPTRNEVLSLLERAGEGEVRLLESRLEQIGDPALGALARARIAATRLDGSGARRALEDYFSAGDRGRKGHGLAWEIAANSAFSDGDYPRAAAAARELLDLTTDNRDEVAQMYGIAAALSGEPRQSVVQRDPTGIATHRDAAGLLRAAVTINGSGQDAVIDTGANLSVLSASAAERLGIRLLEGENSVGSATRAAVATRLGLAERMEVAGITLANVAFLVLDDRQLELPLPGGYKIDAIVGFPVLRAMQRITFATDGGLTAEIPAGIHEPAEENLRVVGNSLYINAVAGGMPVAMMLDTGAAQSHLSVDFAHRHPRLLEGLQRGRERYAGAGGTTTLPVALWPRVNISIGGRNATLPELPIHLPGGKDENTDRAILGMDLLNQFETYTLDFHNRRLVLGTHKKRVENRNLNPSAAAASDR